jgi:hypothetical protein
MVSETLMPTVLTPAQWLNPECHNINFHKVKTLTFYIQFSVKGGKRRQDGRRKKKGRESKVLEIKQITMEWKRETMNEGPTERRKWMITLR